MIVCAEWDSFFPAYSEKHFFLVCFGSCCEITRVHVLWTAYVIELSYKNRKTQSPDLWYWTLSICRPKRRDVLATPGRENSAGFLQWTYVPVTIFWEGRL
jgi:hypothetical protein